MVVQGQRQGVSKFTKGHEEIWGVMNVLITLIMISKVMVSQVCQKLYTLYVCHVLYFLYIPIKLLKKAIKKNKTHQISNELNCELLIYINTFKSIQNDNATCLAVDTSLTRRTNH